MKIQVEKLSERKKEELQIETWPIWEKEISSFPWKYDNTEVCYIIEGEIIVKTDTETIRIGPGDFVTFPKDLACQWEIVKPVRKYFNFL
jgi:uncharacterized protein